MPVKPSQAMLSCIDMCQNTQNNIRVLADTTNNNQVKDELNKAYMSIDACIKQCQSANSHLS